MSQQKSTFKENYNNGELTLRGDFSGILGKKDLQNFKKDLYKILIEIHHTKLRRFENSWRRFNSLLKRSERLYKKLPTSIKVEGINSLLVSEKKIAKFIDTYQREELSEDPVGILKTATKKREGIKDEISNRRKEQVSQIKSLKIKFISDQWNKYEVFFNEDLSFRNEVNKVIREYFKIKPTFHFEIKNNLIKVIKIRKHIIEIFKKKIEDERIKLLDNIQNPEKLKPDLHKYSFVDCFVYILFNSDLKVETEIEKFSIKLDINKFYNNFFRVFSRSNKLYDITREELEFDKNYFAPSCLRIDTIYNLKKLFDKEHGILSFKEVRTKKIVNIELDPKHIKKSRIKAEEQKTPIFKKHESEVLIKLDIQKIVSVLIKKLYSPEQEGSMERNLREIKKDRGFSERFKILVKNHRKKFVVPVVLFLIVFMIVYGAFLLRPVSSKVQKYDSVKIDYTAWESDENENYNELNPLLDTTLWVTMVPITENDTTGLILGLYNTLIGKKLFFKSDLTWLNRCIDQNRDGIDDITGAVALTYGNFMDLYFNTCLMIQLKVLGIQKPELSQSDIDTTIWRITFTVLGFLAITITAIVLIVMIIILAKKRLDVHREAFPKTQLSHNENLVKYGLLVGGIISIPFIVLGIINLRFPLSDFDLIIQYYPDTILLFVIWIIFILLLFILGYLFIFSQIKGKRKKKIK